MSPTKGPWHIQVHSKTTVRQEGAKIHLRIDDYYDPTISSLHIVDSDGRLIAAVAALDGVNEQAENAALISQVPQIIERCASVLATTTGPEADDLRALLFRLTKNLKFG